METKKEKKATHFLKCSHSLNSRSRYDYKLPVVLLKEMPDGLRAKVLVLNGKPYIRYVLLSDLDKSQIDEYYKSKLTTTK
jgi:hypothetical protein